MELIFAYAAGLLTLINPCVLPVLPIVLVGALQSDPRGPIALSAGMSVAFVAFGMLIATAGYAIGLTAETLSIIGAAIMLITIYAIFAMIGRVSPGRSGLLMMTEVVVAVFSAAILIPAEALSFWEWIGAAMIIGAGVIEVTGAEA